MLLINSDSTKLMFSLKMATKLITVIIITLLAILSITILIYKPVYKVTLSGKSIGYINDKKSFEFSLNKYLNASDDTIAYVHIDEIPEYKFVLLKRATKVSDTDTYELLKQNTILYTRAFGIYDGNEEIAIMKTEQEAIALLDQIKATVANSKLELSIYENHVVNPEFSVDTNSIVASMNEKYTVKTVAKKATNSSATATIARLSFKTANPAIGSISSRYGYRNGGEYHTGIDIANPIGTPIYAAADGIVTFAGVRGTYGRILIIEHEDNMITYYAHCDKLLVKEGDLVSLGDTIATIGMTGRTTGPHLHFEVRINNEPVNPQNYIMNIGK